MYHYYSYSNSEIQICMVAPLYFAFHIEVYVQISCLSSKIISLQDIFGQSNEGGWNGQVIHNARGMWETLI